MERLSLPVSRTVRENVAVLLTYAFSRAPLEALVTARLEGEFQQFRETAFVLAAQRAERACLELAIMLRYLDDEGSISSTYGHSDVKFGVLVGSDGTTGPLTLRDVANKMIHARAFSWDTMRPNQPTLICQPRDNERWLKASIDVVALSVVCGSLLE